MEKIDIRDLSIGDWVYLFDPTFKEESIDTYQIVEIRENGINVYPFDDVFEEDWIEPIPLTPEILEANGFEKNGEYNEWNIGTWETPDLIGVSLERPSIIVKHKGTSIFLDQAKHIHELQHVLRLAKVGKEIEL